MRDVLSRRYRMFLFVRSALTTFQPVVDATPNLKTRSLDFFAQLQVLDDGTTLGVASTGDITQAKNLLRERLGNACFSIANAIWSLADATNDPELKSSAPTNMTLYLRDKEVNLLGRYRAVMSTARRLSAELEPYGVSRERLLAAEADLAAFSLKIGTPLIARRDNANKLSDFIEEFRKMDEILERLDRMVNAVKVENEEFHRAYFNARVLGYSSNKKENDAAPPVERSSSAAFVSEKRMDVPLAPLVERGSSFSRPG